MPRDFVFIDYAYAARTALAVCYRRDRKGELTICGMIEESRMPAKAFAERVRRAFGDSDYYISPATFQNVGNGRSVGAIIHDALLS